jgi:glycosyltransferase involved in cell wall biosynthesis
MNYTTRHSVRHQANRAKEKFAVIIPVYNHPQKVGGIIRAALALNVPVVVIDDGSSDSTHETIKNIPGIRIVRHPKNLGKGAALMTGFAEAAGFADWAITIDADGQHDPLDARKLIAAAKASPAAIIIGRRQGMNGANVRWTSRFGRKFSNFWVRASGGPTLSDSQSGFRIYPLPESLNLGVTSRRFEFEVEILVRANRQGMPVVEVPVSVTYEPAGERISHFRPWRDFLRNSSTFSRLIFERVLINPFFNRRD